MRRHLSLWPHGTRGVRSQLLVHTPNGRWTSTAPPLSILSWSVDATGHSHHLCRRRLQLSQRIPLMHRTITEAAPDIVALQGSSPEVAEALCSRHVPERSMGVGVEAHCEEVGGSRAGEHPVDAPAPGGCRYEQIGTARNGRCGDLQLFRRIDSIWSGRLLPSFPCLTAEFVCIGSRGASEHKFVLSNVDLSYRGKSLGFEGKLLVAPEVSSGGNPFTLRVSGGGPTQQQQRHPSRVKGQLDQHREVALEFVSQVAKPDVLLGNFFMGHGETMPGYADAWRLSGAPAHHERTINTFARHKIDSQTNFFYFVPNDEQEDLNETAPGTDSVTCGTATIRPSEGTDALVGTRVSLFDPSPFPDANHSNNNDSGRAIPLTSAANAGGTSKPSSFSVPQVAGRFQRCFFRSLSSRHHKKEYPLMRRYARKQLLVLRPFTEVTLSEREARMYNRGGDYRAHCSASDTYPILVLLA